MTAPRALAVVIGRAGSKGLPGKNALPLAGRPMVAHAVVHARAATCVDRVIVSTDGAAIAAAAREAGAEVVERPAALADDHATVDAAVRHAVEACGATHDVVVILYANVPVRPAGLIDRAVATLRATGADSVQSYAPVGKHHPWWMSRLDAEGRVAPYEASRAYRRQDLPPVFVPDGGVIAVRRASLFTVVPGEPHAFLGADRRGIANGLGAVVDVDDAIDLRTAEAILAARPRAPLAIAGRAIDPGAPPYVIAEIGVNHDGDRARLLALVDAAADAGADAVKTQHFRADLLLSRAATLAAYQAAAGAADPASMLRALELSPGDLEAFAERARRRGVHAILTVFSPALVPEAARIGFDAWKVASPDLVNRPLLEALLAAERPLVLSTGAADPAEIAETEAQLPVDRPRGYLHCVSRYPTPDDDAALGGIAALRAIVGEPVGYSDHTTAIDAGALAVAAGASILEKHLTHDRAARGPDHAASLDAAGFAAYVAAAHRAHRMRGPREKRVAEREREVRGLARQSVTAVRDLPAGHVLAASDLCVKRPGTGVPAARLAALVGRPLARAAERDMPLTEAHLGGAPGSGDA